jgi:hypothetical protein
VPNNPIFGLNAIGGALTIEMKNGFTYQGKEAEAMIGPYGRRPQLDLHQRVRRHRPGHTIDQNLFVQGTGVYTDQPQPTTRQ